MCYVFPEYFWTSARLSSDEQKIKRTYDGTVSMSVNDRRGPGGGAECALATGSGVYVRVHCQTCYLLCEQVRLALASPRRARAPAIFVSRGRRYIKLSCIDPHLLYLEAGADHLAGDRALVCLLDSLRHGCESRAQRATRAVVAPVLSGARLFLVSGVVRSPHRIHSGVTSTRERGGDADGGLSDTAGLRDAVAVRGAETNAPRGRSSVL